MRVVATVESHLAKRENLPPIIDGIVIDPLVGRGKGGCIEREQQNQEKKCKEQGQ